MKKNAQFIRLLHIAIVFLQPLALHAIVFPCDSLSLPSNLEKTQFRHMSNTWLSKATPYHSAQDILITLGEKIVIEGKFSYGSISKDLEGEEIEIWVDNCSKSLVRLGTAVTDEDGRSSIIVNASNFPRTGVFQIYHRVMGDGTFTTSMLRILPKKTRLVVFDIDGTLTVGDSELWTNILNGSYVPVSRKGASELTQHWYRAGYEIVYLSGRHYLLTSRSRQWLNEESYADGTLIVAQSVGEIFPNDSGVGEYKRKYLKRLQESDFIIESAYGNSKTDIYAYEHSSIPKAVTFILGKYGAVAETVALGEDFVAHLSNLFELGSI
jgi:phosphatidate phosphatase PAH1